MNVEKIIRILGYAVYAALWSPVIVFVSIIGPFVSMIMFKSISDGWKVYTTSLKAGIIHDKEFIKTGVWG